MTEGKKQELRQLLIEAMDNIVIHNSDNKPSSLSVERYRNRLQKRWMSYSSDSLEVGVSFKPYIVDENISSKLLDFIREELDQFIHEDEILSASYFILGGLTDRSPLDKLLKQLMKIVIVHGIERAVSDFERCTEGGHGTFQAMALLQGIRLEKEIQASEGIQLVPLTNSPSELPYNVPDLSNTAYGMPKDLYSNKTLLVVDCSISPIFHKPVPDAFGFLLQGDTGPFRVTVGGENSQNFKVDDFYEKFCMALSLACNTPVQIALRWRFLAEDKIFNLSYSGFSGTGYVYHSFQDRFPAVEQVQIDKAKCLYNNLANPNSNIAEKLKIPIDRWIKSKTSGDSEDKIIDLAIALEALYLSGISEPTELSFRLRLHAAWYLRKKIKDRKELMRDIGRIYKWRSAVVHKGKLPEKKISKKKKRPYTQEEITEFITMTQNLCRESIKKVMEDGKFPDWNNLILGEESS